MKCSLVALFLALGVTFAFSACSGAGGGKAAATEDGGLVVPGSGLDVQVAIASAALGDEGCNGSGATRSASKCPAPLPDAAVGTGPCGGPCRPSTIQLQLTAGSGSASAHVEVAGVWLLDSTGAKIQQLSASNPQSWDVASGSYTAWDQTLLPSSEVKASYTLSAPSWSMLGQSYSATYRLEITLQIDGAPLVLQSGVLNREPLLST